MIEVTGSDCYACGSSAGDCYSVLCMGDVLCCDRCDGHDDVSPMGVMGSMFER